MKIRSLLWLSAFTIFIGCSGTNVGNSCTSDDQCGTFKCLRDQRVTTDGSTLTQRRSDMLLLGSTSAIPRWSAG